MTVFHTNFVNINIFTFQNECEPISSKGIYLTGCFQAMLDEIEINSAIVGGVAIGVLVVMVGIIIPKYYKNVTYYYKLREL